MDSSHRIHIIKYFDYIIFILISALVFSFAAASSSKASYAFKEVTLSEAQEKAPEVKKMTYIVKEGDTLESIAASYNIKPVTIAASNNLSANAALKAGQVLNFPSMDGVYYTIQSGDTLWDLSRLNNVDIDLIVQLNKLESADKLSLGKTIFVPNVEKVKRLSRSSTISDSTASVWPVNGTISSKFGKRWGKMHEGIDIAAPYGANVYAFMSGTVVYAGWENGYGNLIIIRHENGLESYYGHNSKLLVKAGETVKKGEHIAEVGSTGNSTGPHCHFEIRKNGVPVNPLNYLD